MKEPCVNNEEEPIITRNFLNFKISSIPIDGSIIFKINNFEGTQYLYRELIFNILSYRA